MSEYRMSDYRWCPVCAEPYKGPELAHARRCPGFRHMPTAARRRAGEGDGGVSPSGYKSASSDGASRG